ncbi:MAG TPA: YgjP-like metallopeptidase domain-containing protein, partial [Chitinispirillaceae bacterium]|nr:YgjP-like metallopeptidase domain-containing protein [Chitinispirillaceae bacterium]
MPPEQVDMVVRSKRMWIYRNLAEWRDLKATAVVREWVNGETFLYLGSAYRLSLISGQVETLKLKDGRFCLNREIIDTGRTEAAKKTFENFYIEKGTDRLNERIARYSPKIGVKPTNSVVKELGYRWASCSSSNALSIHWKCMMAPVKIID